MLKDFARQSLAGLRLLVVATVILGVGYPAAVWGLGQVVSDRAEGQLVRADGEVVGSRLLGQQFEGDEWFLSRPSPNDYDTLASAPSNLGPSSPDLLALIDERRAEVAEREDVDPSDVPADALTGSGSGLDPHISEEYAEIQAARVAEQNGLSPEQVSSLIEQNTEGRSVGFLGEPGVNVLLLNLAVQEEAAGVAG